MANPNQSDLDFTQAMKRCVNAAEDTLLVEMGASTGFAIELSEADGDSVGVRGLIQVDSSTVNSATADGAIGSVLACDGYSDYQIMAKNIAAITGTANLVIQVSPVTSGDIWFDSSATLALTGSADQISSIASLIARRVRLKQSDSDISIGSATVYLLARG